MQKNRYTKQNGTKYPLPLRNNNNVTHAVFSNIMEAKKLEKKRREINRQITKYEISNERSEQEILDAARKILHSSGRLSKHGEEDLPEIVLSPAETKRSRLPSLPVHDMNLILCVSADKAGDQKHNFLPAVAGKHGNAVASIQRRQGSGKVVENKIPTFGSTLNRRPSFCPSIIVKTNSPRTSLLARRLSEPMSHGSGLAMGSGRGDWQHSPNLLIPRTTKSEMKKRPDDVPKCETIYEEEFRLTRPRSFTK